MDDKLAVWITNEMKKRGWSIRETSRRAGISHTPIAKILSEHKRPGLEIYKALARVFDTPLEDVLRIAGVLGSLPSATQKEQEILRILRRLSPEQQDFVLDMLYGLKEPPREN